MKQTAVCRACGIALVGSVTWRKIPEDLRPKDHRRHAGRGLCTTCIKVSPHYRGTVDRTWTPTIANSGLPCRQLNPDLFFSFEEEDTRQALDACQRCPAQGACLVAAIEHQEYWGIWGGQYIFQGRVVDPVFYREQLQEAA